MTHYKLDNDGKFIPIGPDEGLHITDIKSDFGLQIDRIEEKLDKLLKMMEEKTHENSIDK